MIKLRLVGCDRYNFRGELYEKGKVYSVGENKATLMLRAIDDYDRPYFARYQAPEKKSARVLAAEAAAALARVAAEEAEAEGRVEEVVARPDGSEPDKVVEPEAVSEPVVVDTDDDPALDEDASGNPEEVVEEESANKNADEDEDEDADRADGSEVEV